MFTPEEGEIIYGGTDYTISWTAPGFESVDITLYKGQDAHLTIVEAFPNEGFCRWEIPDGIDEGPDYSIIISNAADKTQSIQSGMMVIRKQGQISSFMDQRDGQIYKTVKIGNQWWMAENFNFKCEGSYCYNDSDSNCLIYGKLYTLEAALLHVPEGWRLPSDQDWKQLEAYLGIAPDELDKLGGRGRFSGRLLSNGGGSGFDALSAGYFSWCKNASNHLRYEADFWTSTYTQEGLPILRIILTRSGKVIRYWPGCQSACSVRYIKNDE